MATRCMAARGGAAARSQRRFNSSYFDRAESGGVPTSGAYGAGSAPLGWAGKTARDGPKMQDPEVQALLDGGKEGRQRLKEDYKIDLSPRGFDDAEHAGVPLFKMKIVKKSQADIDRENLGGLDIANLTDAQRESIRRRREKRAAGERFGASVRAFLRAGNRGRNNMGLFNVGDNNAGFFNYGDSNKGFCNKGDYNHGALCFGNDNGGAVILGNGNRGALIWGDQSRGFEIWGNRQSGVCKTSDSFIKLRIRVAWVLLALMALCLPGMYYQGRRKQREKWLKAMDIEVTDEAIDALMSRNISGR
eukprot:TRINITY_DN22803_c0_g1_i1.p1 TRINITY_DN22803_c0_g1~~TRINITY_DN22803_c0_g1_i1.p1  ORF type:complete len:304 (+),score=117.68 TRINITY_DN22803_c0_g1_i1:63-974(+)